MELLAAGRIGMGISNKNLIRHDRKRQFAHSAKRVFDVSLIVLASPVWIPVVAGLAAFVFVCSPGPVLFRQNRVGRDGRIFTLLKFRSMRLNAETDSHSDHVAGLIRSNKPMHKLDGRDPRVIPFGGFLRATGLDELPQLFNVLMGDMSLVGPRPCTPEEFSHYKQWQKRRFNVLPGLTGLWQVCGKNETTFSGMIHLDNLYALRSSTLLDLWIMWRTSPAIWEQVKRALAVRRAEATAEATAAAAASEEAAALETAVAEL
jgi:lipopolysaccharide/colanic/teichoic acid biosynthesis glycosyltransferase